jgi:hypothetical protein
MSFIPYLLYVRCNMDTSILKMLYRIFYLLISFLIFIIYQYIVVHRNILLWLDI